MGQVSNAAGHSYGVQFPPSRTHAHAHVHADSPCTWVNPPGAPFTSSTVKARSPSSRNTTTPTPPASSALAPVSADHEPLYLPWSSRLLTNPARKSADEGERAPLSTADIRTPSGRAWRSMSASWPAPGSVSWQQARDPGLYMPTVRYGRFHGVKEVGVTLAHGYRPSYRESFGGLGAAVRHADRDYVPAGGAGRPQRG